MGNESMRHVTRARFETEGPSWAERGRLGELNAVLSPHGTERRNLFLHTVSLYAARRALAVSGQPGILLDYGCGTGRMLRFFGAQGWSVIGTEITTEMLEGARRFGLPEGTRLHITDGVDIPLPDESVDIIWICGVLKYSLFPPGTVCRGGAAAVVDGTKRALAESFVPVYRDIAQEMYRVLKAGGCVVNDEVYVDAPPETFTRDFEEVGFATLDVRVLHRYGGRLERFLQRRYIPHWCVSVGARLSAACRFHLDDPRRSVAGVRDYLFIWTKPKR